MGEASIDNAVRTPRDERDLEAGAVSEIHPQSLPYQ